ncbi:MAG: transcription antitermination protein [Haloarculaceae archaeon]
METELDRLGSEKSLLAATEARLEPDPVLVTAGTTLQTARDVLADWADDATDETAAETLQTVAERLDAAVATVTAEMDGDGDEITALEAPFLSLEATGDIERVAAGTIGLPLVLDRLFLQAVSFFVNEADTGRADLFRDLRAETDTMLAAGTDALDELCTGEEWDRAETSANAVIDAAYDDYAERLDAMGFDPKPIC